MRGSCGRAAVCVLKGFAARRPARKRGVAALCAAAGARTGLHTMRTAPGHKGGSKPGGGWFDELAHPKGHPSTIAAGASGLDGPPTPVLLSVALYRILM